MSADDQWSEGLITADEVAKILGVKVYWVYDHTKRAEPIIPHIRLADGERASIRFRRKDIIEFIESRLRKAS
jgi:predicted DNA-binding transcriptional regulator AlpA